MSTSKLWLTLVGIITVISGAIDIHLGGVNTSIFVPWYALIMRGMMGSGGSTGDSYDFPSITHINPATGLPMQMPDTTAGYDVGGHLYGFSDPN
jgi:hypothetical protein